jgi:hypothetical protein
MLFGETVAVYCENHTEHTDTLCGYTNPVCTSQKTHYVSTTKPNQLILFGEIIVGCSENHKNSINTSYCQNAEFLEW